MVVNYKIIAKNKNFLKKEQKASLTFTTMFGSNVAI